jgi:hypothetical protein
MESRHLQGCSPRVCRLRTDGLTPVRKYWLHRSHVGVYGHNNHSSWLPTGAWICPHYFIGISGEKLGTDPRIGQPACCGLCREPFSREQWLCSTLLMTTWKVAICGPHEIRMVLDHMQTERGKCVACWSGFPLEGVHQFESLRLLDTSNRLFVAVIT